MHCGNPGYNDGTCLHLLLLYLTWICPLSLVPALSLHKKSRSWDGATLLSSHKIKSLYFFLDFSSGVPHAHYTMQTVSTVENCGGFFKERLVLAAEKRKTKRVWPSAASFGIQLRGKILPECGATVLSFSARRNRNGGRNDSFPHEASIKPSPQPTQAKQLPIFSLTLSFYMVQRIF